MKKIIVVFLVLVLAAFIWSVNPKPPVELPQDIPTPTNTLVPTRAVTINGKQIHYAFITASPDRVTLIPNFTQKKTSDQIINDQACTAGINGGFYDTSNRPLGLFTVNGQQEGKSSGSKLINGYLSISEKHIPAITFDPPTLENRLELQTGPLLILGGQPLTLAIKNDEHARRMVAAVTTEGALIFITLFDAVNSFDGPILEDVPRIISVVNKQELLNITDAINLDGGSASAFYNEMVKLSELTSVGSFFCVKTL